MERAQTRAPGRKPPAPSQQSLPAWGRPTQKHPSVGKSFLCQANCLHPSPAGSEAPEMAGTSLQVLRAWRVFVRGSPSLLALPLGPSGDSVAFLTSHPEGPACPICTSSLPRETLLSRLPQWSMASLLPGSQLHLLGSGPHPLGLDPVCSAISPRPAPVRSGWPALLKPKARAPLSLLGLRLTRGHTRPRADPMAPPPGVAWDGGSGGDHRV